MIHSINFDNRRNNERPTESEKLRESLNRLPVNQARSSNDDVHDNNLLRVANVNVHRHRHSTTHSPPPIDPHGKSGKTNLTTDELSRLLAKEKFTSKSWNDNVHVTQTYEEEGDICEQCRLEELHMNRMRQQADDERHRHEEAERKAHQLEQELQEKERKIAEENERKRRELLESIDAINRDLMEAKKKQKEATPTQDINFYFGQEDNGSRFGPEQKEQLREYLERQIEESRKKKQEDDVEELNKPIFTRSKSFILLDEESDDHEGQVQKRAREMAKRQMDFQKELAERQGPVSREDSWMWWVERPDEHGWREARLKQRNNQIDRNLLIKNSMANLEEFKRKQAEQDRLDREARKAKYEKIRERLNEEAKANTNHRRQRFVRPAVLQTDPRVEEAWRKAHEKYDKRYRSLQNISVEPMSKNPSNQSGSGPSYVDINAHTSCRRCIRCSRPLERRARHSVKMGESVVPNSLTWFPN